MSATLRLTGALYDGLMAMATNPIETGAVLIAHQVVVDDSTVVLLGDELIAVPDEAYEIRTDNALQITSDGYVHALKTARERGKIALWVHSHPGDGAVPRPSTHDRRVNEDLAPLFGGRTETDQYGYLVVSHDAGNLTFTGELSGPVTTSITCFSAVGERWTFRAAHDTPAGANPGLFDRNIRAFGSGIQNTISTLTVAIVGAGGTGSATAEQLARLGVRSFILIDPDTLSASNTTRVYGSTLADVGRPKVDVLGDHLERIADTVHTVRIQGSILAENIARTLAGADVVFGCTDDNAGRLRLSRLPYYYLVPVIDCGVQIPADESGLIAGVFGRVTTLHPGAACLVCRDRIDLALAEAEIRSAEEQQRLEKEGYAPALPGVEPAVVTFTTLVAATAVSELLERLVGYGDSPTPSELILYVHDRTVRSNIEDPRSGHYCDPNIRRIGTDADMFLGLNWTS
ncbi:ThiF family adenylyltransferase [Plantibacter auratus]|uniref:ThiF family adenylyltransferase n=1 Tax=Plantibacter auratus TaxID=272914 RepID=UPI003D324D61